MHRRAARALGGAHAHACHEQLREGLGQTGEGGEAAPQEEAARDDVAPGGAVGPEGHGQDRGVVHDGVHRRKTAQAIYRRLKGIGFAKDIVVVTESDVRQFGENPSLVICPALRRGKEIYHAAG